MRETVKLTVVFEELREGGFIARVPAIPGCVAEGGTLEHAEGLARDAIRAHCAGLRRLGEPLPTALSELVEFMVVEAPA